MTEETGTMNGFFDKNKEDIKLWGPLVWYMFMGAFINAYVLILFSAEDFLQQYTGLIKYSFVSDFLIPAFKGWAISLIPIGTGFLFGYILESRVETESIKPLAVFSMTMTAVTALTTVMILLAPALFGWVAGVEGFELTTIMIFIILVILIFPLSFIGAFLGAIMVSY